jgi:hypothetical protein
VLTGPNRKLGKSKRVSASSRCGGCLGVAVGGCLLERVEAGLLLLGPVLPRVEKLDALPPDAVASHVS